MMAKIKKKNWFVRHWIISILLLVFVVIPFMVGVFQGIFGNNSEITGEIVNEQPIEINQQEEIKTCVSAWNCGSWSGCEVSGIQERVCTDSNDCGANLGKPSETQICIYNYGLEEIIPLMTAFPTEYTRGNIEEIERDNGNLKAYDTTKGFVNGKSFSLSKYQLGGYSIKDYFDIEIMFYEFEEEDDAINFKKELENYMEGAGGYSEIKLNTLGDCFNTKEDFGYIGGNVASSVCQKRNIIYWTILSITNSFKDSENYIGEFIEVIENKLK